MGSRTINTSEDQHFDGPLHNRTSPEIESRYHEFGPYLLDSHLCVLYRDGATVSLAHKTFETLLILVRNRDRVVSREELLHTIWEGVNVEASNITQNIYVLRKALEKENGEVYIKTIPGKGYRFVGEISDFNEAPRARPSSVAIVLPRLVAPQPTDEVVLPDPAERKDRKWIVISALIVSVVAACITVAILLRFRQDATVAPVVRFATSLPGSALQPALSPDASHVAFAWNGEDQSNYDIYVKPLLSETATRLTFHSAVDTSPAWSPDGQSIAFLRLAQPDGGLFIIPARGGAEKRVAGAYPDRLGIKARHLDWSPDGKVIVLDDKGGPQEGVSLFLISVATGERRRLTSAPGRSPSDLAPRFSPDGATVAFMRSSSASVRDIYVVPAAGGQPTRLTFDERWVGDIDWSPDGHEILFTSDRTDQPGLWAVSARPGKPSVPRRLSPTADRACYLSVARHPMSHGGSRLAYSQSIETTDLWKLDLQKHSWAKLALPMHDVAAPDYSPDGSRILFRSDTPGKRRVRIVKADGSGLTALPFEKPVHSAGWSPDGTMLTLDIREQGHYHIYTASETGSQTRQLTFADFDDEYPRWAPDGKAIFFSSNRTGHWQIWRVPVTGGMPEQVTQDGGYAARFSRDGKTLFYSKHQSLPGVWSIPIAGGAEIATMPQMRPERWGLWAVSADGIYFVDDDGAPGLNHAAQVKFYGFADRRITSIAELPKPVALTGFLTLTISPDHHSLLLPLIDRAASDVVVVDHFR